MPASKCRIPWLGPWKHRVLQSFDEESNKVNIIEYSGLMRPSPRTLHRTTRLLLVLLVSGILIHSGLYLTADSWRQSPQANRVLSKSYIDAQAKAQVDIDWSNYAYTQYVTDPTYLCNSLMIFESLHRLGSEADRLMMYPEQWSAESNTSEAGLLRKARHEYNVKLQPVQVKRFENDGSTWAESFTKLFAFNQTQYQRVISLDSDATVLQSMDELFFLPRAPVAMPRAYWIDDIFSTQIVVIEPSALEFERIQHAFEHRTMIEFDMEIMNKLYSQDCLILPHRRYDLVTGEFRSKEHDRYLGSSNEVWDARKVLEEVSYLHFSDWPYPKPWSEYSDVTHAKLQPPCQESFQGEEDCSTRDVWNEVYLDFMQRRQEVCGSRFMPD